MDERLQKWIKWLEAIRLDVQSLVIAKDIFWSVQGLIRENQRIRKPSGFYRYLGYTYATYALMGIRRQIKIDKQSISLARLLCELADDPTEVSREYFRGLYGAANVDRADRAFGHFSGADPRYISSHKVQADLQILKSTIHKCEKCADRRIAHLDARQHQDRPTFNEIDECIDTLDKLYVKYHLLFHASSMESLVPTYQYDWMAIFDEPWRQPGTDPGR